MYDRHALMSAPELEQFLHRSVPLSQAMALQVRHIAAERVVLAAPIAPNINQHATVFGGSQATLGVLAAWSLVHIGLSAQKMH